MAGPILYSANPWIAHQIAVKYLGGIHFAWCSECYDPTTEPATSAAFAIAPSSSPCGIVQTLKADCKHEDKHSQLIQKYKKKFKLLAKTWIANRTIDDAQYQEIVSVIKSASWNIWEPVLYVIPRAAIASTRLHEVPLKDRASYGPEFQIVDLHDDEFDRIVSL